MKSIPTWPNYSDEEILIASSVLRSGRVNYWTGKNGRKFEEEFSNWCKAKYAISQANGSLALYSAYHALKLKAGDEIITSPRTFIATSSSACIQNITPVYADVDIYSGNITPETIECLINKKTKAISVVHLGGWPADMKNICDLARSKNISIVEDCSQAHGAEILINKSFKPVGSFGDISVWSFCQDKIISTGGEGGMVATNNNLFADIIWSLRDHGKDKKLYLDQRDTERYKWVHNTIGLNFRLTEIQSAIGRKQLKLLPAWREIRTRNAMALTNELLKYSCIRVSLPSKEYKHAWYKYYCYIERKNLKSDWTRDRIIHEIRLLNYPVYQGSCSEIYKEKCLIGYHDYNYLTNAKELGETSIMFLVHPTITDEIMEDYIKAISNVLKRATK